MFMLNGVSLQKAHCSRKSIDSKKIRMLPMNTYTMKLLSFSIKCKIFPKKACLYYNKDKINDGNHCDNSLYRMDIVLHTNSLAFKRQNSRNYLK